MLFRSELNAIDDGKRWCPALFGAIHVNNRAVIEILLDTKRVEYSSTDGVGDNVVHKAIKLGHADALIGILNKAKINLNQRDTRYGRLPLVLALSSTGIMYLELAKHGAEGNTGWSRDYDDYDEYDDYQDYRYDGFIDSPQEGWFY